MPRRLVLRCFLLWTLLLAWVPDVHAAAEATPSLLRSGPMVGSTTVAEVEIWLQTAADTSAQVRFWPKDTPSAARLSGAISTSAAGDRIARFRLTDLNPGSAYEYEVYLDGVRVPLSWATRFTTQAIWRHRTDPPNLRAAIGSCFYVNDPAHDRPGDPYGGGFEILDAILAREPDLLLWLGDNVYYRESDLETEQAMRRRYAHTRELPALQPLLASEPQYAIWDDHDYGPNDSDRTFREREAALRVFRDYWANPSSGTAETPGVFGRFEWGDVEFFLLDNRYHRTPNRFVDEADKRMFGRMQLRWFEESLASSNATFKIVAGGNQFWNPLVYFEGLAKFPVEHRELRDYLRRAKIPGVLFLSGDRHHSELLKIEVPGLYPFYEFTSSPLTSGLAKSSEREGKNSARIDGTLVNDRRNFGLIEVTGPADDRSLTFRTIDSQGVEVWQHTIRARELAVPTK